MGKNDFEKLLNRTLNENQYKKVKDLLEKEPQLNVQTNSDMAISGMNRPFGGTISAGLNKQGTMGKKGILRTNTLKK